MNINATHHPMTKVYIFTFFSDNRQESMEDEPYFNIWINHPWERNLGKSNEKMIVVAYAWKDEVWLNGGEGRGGGNLGP